MEFGAAFAGVFGGGELAADFVQEGENLFDAGSVFAFEFVDGGEAGFDFLEAGGVGFEMAEVALEGAGGFLDGDFGGAERVAEFGHGLVDTGHFVDALQGGAESGVGGFRSIVEGLVGGAGAFGELVDVLEDAAFLIERGIFAGVGRDILDLFFLEGPEVGQAGAFLFGPVEIVEFGGGGAPLGMEIGDASEGGFGEAELVDHFALGVVGEETLLIVLAVDVAEEGSEFLQKGGGNGAAIEEGARLTVGQDFAFEDQFVFGGFDAGMLENGGEGGGLGLFEDAGDAGAFGAAAHHFGRGAATEEQAEGVDDDGFAGAGLAGEEVQTRVEADAESLDDGVVFNQQFDQHAETTIIAAGGGKEVKTFRVSSVLVWKRVRVSVSW